MRGSWIRSEMGVAEGIHCVPVQQNFCIRRLLRWSPETLHAIYGLQKTMCALNIQYTMLYPAKNAGNWRWHHTSSTLPKILAVEWRPPWHSLHYSNSLAVSTYYSDSKYIYPMMYLTEGQGIYEHSWNPLPTQWLWAAQDSRSVLGLLHPHIIRIGFIAFSHHPLRLP